MKKVLQAISFSVLITSCNNNVVKNNETSSVQTDTLVTKMDSSKIYKAEAITILNKVDGFMKKGIKKELSTAKVNEKINPLMKNYEYLLSKLNQQDSAEVQDYRIRQINEMVDLQMQQSH